MNFKLHQTRSGLVLVLCLCSSSSFLSGCSASFTLLWEHSGCGRRFECFWTKAYVDGWSRGPQQPTCRRRSVRFLRTTSAPYRMWSLCDRFHQWTSGLSRFKSKGRPHQVLRLGLSCFSGGLAGTISKLQASQRIDCWSVLALVEEVVWHCRRRTSPLS